VDFEQLINPKHYVTYFIFYLNLSIDRNDCPNSSGYPVGSGVLISPNYPNAYSDNQDCIYFIDAGNINRRLRLDFDVFDLEPNYDFVSIFDGDSQVSRLIAKLAKIFSV